MNSDITCTNRQSRVPHSSWRPAFALLVGILTAAQPLGAQQTSSVNVLRGTPAEAIHTDLLGRAESGFGGAVIIEKDGELVLSAGYGWANREQRHPFTTTTIAQIGSLSKQFTAMAVIDLEQRGQLEFSDSLGAFLEGVPTAARAITVHQLLTHTSGLPEYCGEDFAPATRAEFLARCLSQPLQHPPGTRFAYSNPGYSVLAAIVELVSGSTLEEYLAEHLFAPLGLPHTGYLFPGLPRSRFAVGYTMAAPQEIVSERIAALDGAYWNLKGNGGMQASAEDIYAWYRAFSHGPVITDSMRAVAFRPYAQRDSTVSYGYGWFVRSLPDGRVAQVSHTGSDGVFMSVFVWRPVDRLFLYVVGNNGGNPPVEIARAILRAFAPNREGS